MQLTTDILIAGLKTNSQTAATWLSGLQDACDKFQINTPQRVAAFLANVGVESGGLRLFEENLNYSAQGLAATWPNRYSANPHGENKAPNELAMHLQRNPVAIANNVYADRLGNGHEMTGDGWKYRGVGPIQITGKTNQWACMLALDLDPTEVNFNLLCHQPGIGSESAAWFFAVYAKCNDAADKGDINTVVKLINGQPPVASNGGPARIKAYEDCLAACNAVADAVPAAKPAVPTAKKLPPVKS